MTAAENFKAKLNTSNGNVADMNCDYEGIQSRRLSNAEGYNKSFDSEMSDLVQLIKSQRDDQLKQEIKQLQKESYRLEKEEIQQHQKSKSSILSTFDQEESELLKKIKSCKDEIAELVIDKEKILLTANNTKYQADDLENQIVVQNKEILFLRNELSNITDQRNAKEDEYKRLESMRKKNENDIKASKLQQRLGLKKQLDNEKKTFDSKMQELNLQHKNHLEQLDAQVKTQLARQDAESFSLKEEIEGPKVKIEKLQVLLQQYSSGIELSPKNSRNTRTLNEAKSPGFNTKRNQTVSIPKSSR